MFNFVGEILISLKRVLSLLSRPSLTSILCLCHFFLRGCIYFFFMLLLLFSAVIISLLGVRQGGRADLWVADTIFRFFLEVQKFVNVVCECSQLIRYPPKYVHLYIQQLNKRFLKQADLRENECAKLFDLNQGSTVFCLYLKLLPIMRITAFLSICYYITQL